MAPATAFRGSRRDQIEGVILRVKMDGNIVREYKFPSSMSKVWRYDAEDAG